jgi:hypothetical protein
MVMARSLFLLLAAGALLGCGARPPAVAPAVPPKVASLARGMAASLGDRHVTTAWVIATTKDAAENVTTPGAVPPDRHDPRAYLVLIRGRFVCRLCSRPVGVKPQRGRVAYAIWVPGRGVTDDGLQNRLPRHLRRLGRIVTLRL